MKSKIKSIKVVFIIVSFLLLIVIFAFFRQDKSVPEETVSERISITEIPTYNSYIPQGSFSITRLNTAPNINGYVWVDDKLIYTTNDGIISAGTDNYLVKKSIDYVSTNHSGQIVYSSNGSWYLFSNEDNKINIKGDNAIINSNGTIATILDGKEIELFSIENEKKKTISPQGTSINKIAWAFNSNLLAISSSSQSSQFVEIVEENGSKISSNELPFDAQFVDISPTGDVLVYTKNNELILYNTKDNIEKSIRFDESYSLEGNWITNNEFALIATSTNEYGRTTDFVWKIDKNGNRNLLISSTMIPNKLNTSISLSINKSLTVLPLIEKNNSLWLLSLVTNTIPGYIENAPILYPNNHQNEKDHTDH